MISCLVIDLQFVTGGLIQQVDCFFKRFSARKCNEPEDVSLEDVCLPQSTHVTYPYVTI